MAKTNVVPMASTTRGRFDRPSSSVPSGHSAAGAASRGPIPMAVGSPKGSNGPTAPRNTSNANMAAAAAVSGSLAARRRAPA